MHEWALADAVVKSSLKIKEEKNLEKIEKITIVVGELQGIEEEVFIFALKELFKENSMVNVKLDIRKEKVILRCKNCGTEWEYQSENLTEEEREAIHFLPELSKVYVKCPSCKSHDFEIIKGRGVWIETIEGIQE